MDITNNKLGLLKFSDKYNTNTYIRLASIESIIFTTHWSIHLRSGQTIRVAPETAISIGLNSWDKK